MEMSLLAHECGHVFYSLKHGGAQRGSITNKTGGASSFTDNGSQHSAEHIGLSAISAAAAGFIFELGEQMVKQPGFKAEALATILEKEDLPIDGRYGLQSKHVSDGDLESVKAIDLASPQALEAAKFGAQIAISLLNNQGRMRNALDQFSVGDDILLDHKALHTMLTFKVFLPNYGIGALYISTGFAVAANEHSALAEAIKELKEAA